MSAANRRYRGKRQSKSQGTNDQDEKSYDIDESSEVTKVFREFQKELDQRNDRHERIVKLSRDITIESKRIIFMLHRVTGAGADNKEEILKDAESKMEELHKSKFLPLATELKGQDPHQFLRAFSPGLQEYIEAVTFYYYLKDQQLIGVETIQSDIQSSFQDAKKSSTELSTETVEAVIPRDIDQATTESGLETTEPSEDLDVPIPLTEYMLGVADFTGELMRMAITCVGTGDLDAPKEVTNLMRTIHNAFSTFSNAPRELRRKATVLRQSLGKVENACYNLRVRGSEIPKHMLADVFKTEGSTAIDDNFLETEDN